MECSVIVLLMRMQRFLKPFLIFTICVSVLAAGRAAAAAEVPVYFFYGDGCPHCAKEEYFLEQLEAEDPSIRLEAFEIYNNLENQQLLMDVGVSLNTSVSGVPFTVVGTKYFVGYRSDTTTGADIEDAIEDCKSGSCEDVVGGLLQNGTSADGSVDGAAGDGGGGAAGQPAGEAPANGLQAGPVDTISVPLFGDVDISTFSLPVVTILIAALDGFNPCAMWALLFLITLLLGMENRKRMWLLGLTFLIASAAIYFMFMAAWLQLLLFIGFVLWIRLLIGAVAVIGGVVHLRDWCYSKDGVCKVSTGRRQQKIFEKLKSLVTKQSLLLSMLGIILLGVTVNLVELICSAGLPVVYTQILTLADLSTIQYYGYLLFYILIFLLDDIIIFSIAMVTLQVASSSSKFSRYTKLIGGILMVIIGLLLVFKPEWLMFG